MTNSTVSAEQAREALDEIHAGRMSAERMELLRVFITQHGDACGASSTEPVAAGWRLLVPNRDKIQLTDEAWGWAEHAWLPCENEMRWGTMVRSGDPPIRRRFAAQGQTP